MSSRIRTRWAAIGAALAVAVGTGGIRIADATPVSSGPKPVFVSITPCRLIDTRQPPPKPLGAKATLTLQVTGSTGDCVDIPADAVAGAFNVTAVEGTTQSFLTVYPADVSMPVASNLNWRGGDPPTPNKVDVKLSAAGQINLTNDAGTVHLVVDLVGYYIDHNHDDRYYTQAQADANFMTQSETDARYYTKSQTDAKFSTAANVTVGPTTFVPASTNGRVVSNGCVRNSVANDKLFAGLVLPAGATVTAFSASMIDNSANSSTLVLVKETALPTPVRTVVGTVTTMTQQTTPVLYTVNLASPGQLVTSETWWGLEWSTADASDVSLLCGATIRYTIPAGTSLL